MKLRRFLFIFVALSCSQGLIAQEGESLQGIPNISARPTCACQSTNVFAHLLVWTAREVAPDDWAEVIIQTEQRSSNTLRPVKFHYDPGFRVGVGHMMAYDQWDVKAYYTRFHTEGKDRVTSVPGSVRSTFLGNFYVRNSTGSGLSGPGYRKARIRWDIDYDILDGELGRNFWVSRYLSLRPFLGVRGGWIDQKVRSKWEDPTLTEGPFFTKGKETIENDFWGVGPAGGIETKWAFFCGRNELYVFGDLSGALMWGHWSFRDVYSNDVGDRVTVTSDDLDGGASMIRSFAGLGWDFRFKEGRYRLRARAGYEMQVWFNQLQYYSFVGGRLGNSLTLQGGTLELQLDF